jgi:hypothetical protein
MFLFQLLQLWEGSLDFRMVELTQPGEKRILLVSSVLWCRLPKVAQGSLQRSTGLLNRKIVNVLCNRLQRAEKYLDPPVAVREQAGGVSKVVGRHSNLNRQSLSIPARFKTAVTKVRA